MTTLSLNEAALLAVHYYDAGQWDEAAQLCDQVLGVAPNHEQAMLVKLGLLRRRGDAPGAMALCRRLLAADAFATAPRVHRPQPGPQLLPADLARIFGADAPPVSDISDHVAALYFEAAAARPKLTVELGTRGGESTRALLAATLLSGGLMLSVDIDPCDPAGLPDDARAVWRFVQSDDVAFGRDRFADWCAGQGVAPVVDALFIDTSHLYDHTREELAVWLPFVAPGGVVLLHDTHMATAYLRNDGSVGIGWNNDRGVMRALEEKLGRRYDEKRYFVDVADGWLVRHDPRCSGFTTLRRL